MSIYTNARPRCQTEVPVDFPAGVIRDAAGARLSMQIQSTTPIVSDSSSGVPTEPDGPGRGGYVPMPLSIRRLGVAAGIRTDYSRSQNQA